MIFKCNFTGRLRGAQGKFLTFAKIKIEADTEAQTRLRLYEKYEHITKLVIATANE